ncbi:MAG: calcium/sodium antiporter [Candidatus Krumholzibacteriia bacterium]
MPVADLLILFLGLALLVGGGEVLVRGATALARSLGVSPLVIGLTVVAFGTSAPELAVNITAALRGQGGISFGNVVGSNIANIGLILGISALVRPLAVQRSLARRELPFMLAASLGATLLALETVADRAGGLGAVDGVLLLAGFVVFLVAMLRAARRDRARDPFLRGAEERAGEGGAMGLPLASLLTLAGLAGVIGGGHWTVEGATAIARHLGISEAVIGLSIVAIGTSLPELVTSLVAARHGESDLAVGNVVGSNIFNLLLVLGPTAMIRRIAVPAGGVVDLAVMCALSLALLPLGFAFGNRINRAEGAILLAAYTGYIAWRVLG